MMRKDKGKKPLSPEEAAEILGAERVGPVPDFGMDPIGLMALATWVGRRLASSGGRPTDESWEISRKIPMKTETWQKLNEISEALGKEDVRVAPGQLAAIALEKGLPALLETYRDKVKRM